MTPNIDVFFQKPAPYENKMIKEYLFSTNLAFCHKCNVKIVYLHFIRRGVGFENKF